MSTPYRVAVFHVNKPKMISRITDAFAQEDTNIENLINKSRDQIAYTMLDLDGKPSEAALDKIRGLDGVIRVEVYEA